MADPTPIRRRGKSPAQEPNDAPTGPGPGHNSEVTETSEVVAAGQLRSYLERIERLLEEKQTIADDIKEVYAEAKGTGFDTPIMRKIIQLRKMDQAERQELEARMDLYKAALGMI